MNYLSRDEILALHDSALQAFGGSPGVRDVRMIESAANSPKATFGNQELYPALSDKAAIIGFAIIANHPFVDGNKRTGFLAMDVFLRKNGLSIDCSTEDGEIVTLAVASGEIDRENFTLWIDRHLKPLE